MKGRTLRNIGLFWLAALLAGFALQIILLPLFANLFLGLGIELPINPRTLGVSATISRLVAFVGMIFLGWVPFLLIGLLRMWREKSANRDTKQVA